MVGATVVLANSTVVDCSEAENPDLFWAIRGAGSSMGVVTEFRFKTFEAPETVTYFIAPVPWRTEETAFNGLKAVQDFVQDEMPAELNMRVFITNRFVNLEGMYYGNKTDLQAVLAPLFAKTKGSLAMATQGDWMGALKHFGNGIAIDQGHPYDFVSKLSGT